MPTPRGGPPSPGVPPIRSLEIIPEKCTIVAWGLFSPVTAQPRRHWMADPQPLLGFEMWHVLDNAGGVDVDVAYMGFHEKCPVP